ncbi:MAG: hypothetical protein M0D55_01505 [Elusimicrobiota bacterium]|nr:MAG: hypothetical protein M0D55_01505 [Elusimicrobiota bacterium]
MARGSSSGEPADSVQEDPRLDRPREHAAVEAERAQLEPRPGAAAVREQGRAPVGPARERGERQLRPSPVERAERAARGLLERASGPARGRARVDDLAGELAQVGELLAQRARFARQRQVPPEGEPPPQRGRRAERGQRADDGGGQCHLSKSRWAFT